MKKLILSGLFVFCATLSYSQLVSTEYFFKPRPITALESAEEGPKFDLKPIAQIPAIKITESTRENAELDASFLVSAGGGITLQRIGEKNGKPYSPFSFSPITILLAGNTAQEGAVLDISWCSTIGILNNLVQFGAGYDFGTVEGRSRWFGVLTIGINLTNN